MNLFYLQKFLRSTLTVVLIVTTVFVVLRLSGDPAVYVLGVEAPPEAIEAYRANWGLDRPIWEQYLVFVNNVMHGEFGQSYLEGRSAFEAVLDKLPKTLLLMGLTTLVTLLIGIPAGMYAALHRNSLLDRLTMTRAGMY